jgi:hypothetical protein
MPATDFGLGGWRGARERRSEPAANLDPFEGRAPRMPQTHQADAAPRYVPGPKSLPEQIAEAIESRSTRLSQLLRLMAALEAEGGNEVLRLQLRARIGAPLDA